MQALGNPDSDSLQCLNTVISDFNSLSSSIKLKKVSSSPDIEIHFVPGSQFQSIEPNYIAGNDGFFYFWWNGNSEIYRSRILIDSKKNSPQERCHLIREELTQSMGLARDSNSYPDSIFYSVWGSTNFYSELDKSLIKMLYNTSVPLGADEAQVRQYFAN